MKRYRYCLFDCNGAVVFADVFQCADNEDAKEMLAQLLADHAGTHAFELWHRNRLVLAGLTAEHRSRRYD